MRPDRPRAANSRPYAHAPGPLVGAGFIPARAGVRCGEACGESRVPTGGHKARPYRHAPSFVFIPAPDCQKTFPGGKPRRVPAAAAAGIKSNLSFPAACTSEMTPLTKFWPTISQEIEEKISCSLSRKSGAATFSSKAARNFGLNFW